MIVNKTDIYVDRDGNTYRPAATDQCGSRPKYDRTVNGHPVAYAGAWFYSQMKYKPFKRAVSEAAASLKEA
jgi:hypothetical protein